MVLLEKSELTAGSTWHAVRLGEVNFSFIFFSPHLAEVKAGNGEMRLYVGDPPGLCVGARPSPRVQVNSWVNPTVLLSCFCIYQQRRRWFVFFLFMFAYKHVIRLLVSHMFFVFSVEHLSINRSGNELSNSSVQVLPCCSFSYFSPSRLAQYTVFYF